MERDEREYEAFQILHKIIEDSETFGVFTFLYIEQRTDL